MIWLNDYVDRIKSHVRAGDSASLTYAALEVRLALERICYERLRIAHKYISADDLRTWKPQYVVQTVMEMVDPNIAAEWELSFKPKEEGNYIHVGTQKGFDPKYISRLWQAMSSFLHCKVPRHKSDSIEHYRSIDKLRSKIEEAVNELDRLAQGTMIGATVFQQISFDCICGQRNSRSASALKQDDLINCIKESCTEQYRVERTGEDFLFERRLIAVLCRQCRQKHGLPYRQINEMDKASEGWKFRCNSCGTENVVTWRLMQLNNSV